MCLVKAASDINYTDIPSTNFNPTHVKLTERLPIEKNVPQQLANPVLADVFPMRIATFQEQWSRGELPISRPR